MKILIRHNMAEEQNKKTDNLILTNLNSYHIGLQ